MHLRPTALRSKLLILLVTACVAVLGGSQAAQQKKPITPDVYDSWRSIQGVRVSDDGTWLAYALAAQEGDGELVVRNLATNEEIRQPRGRDAAITPDGRFVLYTVAPPRADVDKAKKDKKKPDEMPKNGLGILDLSTRKPVSVERVKSFKVAEEGGGFVAYLLEAPEKKEDAKPAEKKEEPKPAEKKDAKKEKKKDPGTDLVVRELATGGETRIAEVTDYAFDKKGAILAYAVSSKTPDKDGVFVRTLGDGATTALLAGLGNYKQLAVAESGTQVAFLTDRDDYKQDAAAFRLYRWARGEKASTTAEDARILAAKDTPGLPEGWAPSENGRLEFSKDGRRLFAGLAAAPKAEPEGAPEPVKVDIWHWKDPELQPMQKVRADTEKKRTYRAVIHLADQKLVPLGSMEMPELRVGEEGDAALGQSNVPYRQLVSWDGSYDDFYVVSLADGSRRKVIEKAHFGATLSTAGKYILYFDYQDANWHAVRVADGRSITLTNAAALGVRFDDETSNTPEPARPWGVAGWTEGDRSVLVYDRWDIWELFPEGGDPRMVTNGLGRKDGIVFRYQRLDPEERAIKAGAPLLLSATNEVTRASGFYRITLPVPAPAAAGRGGKPPAKSAPAAAPVAPPEKVLMADKQVGGLVKAKKADTLVFTMQRFNEFPDLWASDMSFANPRKVSDGGAQMAPFIWGSSELITYINADGVALRAILTRPDDFDPAKKYPLMVYIYEELTQGLHRFVAPSPGTSINVTRYVSNGYVVLQPDIVYETGYPGQSALKCVMPAVQHVLNMGFVDPKRVGIQGHSWGGYQITYLITQTDMFRAVQAGASVTNMTSAYGGIRWGTGMSRAFQYEKTQSRIGAPPWERSLQFIENSPLFWVEKVKTPYLTIHNDEDDAVPWYQGIEFFSALRRLGKEAYMFVYNGEKHGLRERDNQKHWTVHQDEFFDHYLKGAPRPTWMDEGVPYLERGKRDVMGQFRGQEK
ncbi:MAG TPA: prolyl oligopeptidase family serine peptidase [Vicinamibacterales bacterium]|nr:prolyl oligopeptidase family serine peptidase [Vicinamibacterales bacterium]